MLQLDNHTQFRAERALLLDGAGSQIWVVVVKATYTIQPGGEPALSADQEPIATAAVWSGEPAASSLLRESELAVAHPGTDVTFNASAHAPGGHPAPHVDVGVMVGTAKRLLRVYGDRVWRKGAMGLAHSSPEPFKRMPIIWERAFGGWAVERESGVRSMEPRNPIGCGFATDPAQLLDRPVPNVEDVLHPLQGWKSRPPPAGLGAIAAHWSPRRERAGSYDEHWRRTRMPLWPQDHDPRFHQAAPSELVCEQPLRGGEEVRTTGLVPEGQLAFHLPRVHLGVETRFAGTPLFQPVQLERVIVEPDARKLVLVWGSRLDCGTRGRKVERCRVVQKARLS